MATYPIRLLAFGMHSVSVHTHTVSVADPGAWERLGASSVWRVCMVVGREVEHTRACFLSEIRSFDHLKATIAGVECAFGLVIVI